MEHASENAGPLGQSVLNVQPPTSFKMLCVGFLTLRVSEVTSVSSNPAVTKTEDFLGLLEKANIPLWFFVNICLVKVDVFKEMMHKRSFIVSE